MSDQGNWAAFIADHHGEETASERASRMARQGSDRDDREAARDEAERAAALQERRELMELAQLQAGVAGRTAGDIFADAGRIGDEDAEYEAARSTIARIDKRRANRQRDMVDQAQRMAEISGLATRSAATITGGEDMLAGAKQAHREFVQATRSAQAAAAAGKPQRQGRRPFGDAVSRSEPVTCAMCLKYGATPEQSFLIHADPAPEPAPAIPSEDEREWLNSRQAGAERRTPGRPYAEISR